MRSEIIAMVCFVRKKFVQNMVRVEEYVREKVIVHVRFQFLLEDRKRQVWPLQFRW